MNQKTWRTCRQYQLAFCFLTAVVVVVARVRELDFRGWHTTRWGAPANIRYPKITVTSPGFLQFPKVKFKLYVTFFCSWWRSWVFFQSKRSVHLKCNTICINNTDIYSVTIRQNGYRSFRSQVISPPSHFAPTSFRPGHLAPYFTGAKWPVTK